MARLNTQKRMKLLCLRQEVGKSVLSECLYIVERCVVEGYWIQMKDCNEKVQSKIFYF